MITTTHEICHRWYQALLAIVFMAMVLQVPSLTHAQDEPAADATSTSTAANISLGDTPEGNLIYLKHAGPYWTIGQKLDEIRLYARKHNLEGRFLVHYLADPSASTRTRQPVRVGLLTDADHAPISPFFRDTVKATTAVQFIRADDTRLVPACKAIKTWAEDKGYQTLGPVTEYFTLASNNEIKGSEIIEMPVEPVPLQPQESQATAGRDYRKDDDQQLAHAESEAKPPMSTRRIVLRRPSKPKNTPPVEARPATDKKPETEPETKVAPLKTEQPPAGKATETDRNSPSSTENEQSARENKPRENKPRENKPVVKPEKSTPPKKQASAMQPNRIQLLSGEEAQTPENKRKKANRPGKIGLDGLNLFQQSPEQELARQLMPPPSRIPADMVDWLGKFSGRVKAIGRAADRLSGDTESLVALTTAIQERYDWVRNQWDMSGEPTPDESR
ncbi:MAG: hypothetical protein ACPGXK_16405, partial [Phycisphaerae bacterium]